MKLMIASDIHGSEYWCRKLIESFEAEKPDRLLILGDILYHGPRNDLPYCYNPKGVIALLNPIADRILSVRGNCDSEVDQMVLDFPIMADSHFCTSTGLRYLQLTAIYTLRTIRRKCRQARFCSADIRISPRLQSMRATPI